MAVLPFKREPEPSAPWWQGPARCQACKHEWRAVLAIPSKRVDLECPQCSTMRGVAQTTLTRNDSHIYRCANCEESTFEIVWLAEKQAPELFCINCGQHEAFINAYNP